MPIGSHLTVIVVCTRIRTQDSGGRSNAGHSAWKLKPSIVDATLVMVTGKSSGTCVSTTSMVGRPTTSGSTRGATVTAPIARFSAIEYFVSVTRAASLLSTGDTITA